MRTLRSNAGLGAGALAVLLLIAAGAGRGGSIDELRLATAAYEQDLVRWEVVNFPRKWLRLAAGAFRRAPEPEARLAEAREFFTLGDEIAARRGDLEGAMAARASTEEADAAQEAVAALERRRDAIAPGVEETLEAALTSALDELGVIARYGPARWPPVDFAFEEGAHLLVRSPRDKVVRLQDRLLSAEMSLPRQAALEREIEAQDPDVSAVVLRIGGLATYPAQITPRTSLRGALSVAAHEWMHHWLAFRPLGRKWAAGGELMSVNETVANIAAEEIGDLTFERLTGQAIARPPWRPPGPEGEEEPPRPTPDPDVFDFRREMRETRETLDALLAEGGAAGAEAYLEERRLAFVANGFAIRRLNTAWFAFHGTYADGPASGSSPIEPQLRTLRADSASLAEFLDRVAAIDAEGELARLAAEAGWRPAGG